MTASVIVTAFCVKIWEKNEVKLKAYDVTAAY